MIRPRRCYALACVAVLSPLLPASLRGEDKAEEKWFLDRSLTLSPRAAPVPALRYRLFPLDSERKDGNAVPIYLRLASERSDANKKYLEEHTRKWNDLPLDKVPLS